MSPPFSILRFSFLLSSCSTLSQNNQNMNIWLQLLLVFISGGFGACLRHIISLALNPTGLWMGFATWVINSSGCLLMGLFAGMVVASSWSNETRIAWTMLLMTGFCGGYSTFSAFTLDCVKYFEEGHLGIWIIFALATIFVGLFACAFGYWAGKQIMA